MVSLLPAIFCGDELPRIGCQYLIDQAHNYIALITLHAAGSGQPMPPIAFSGYSLYFATPMKIRPTHRYPLHAEKILFLVLAGLFFVTPSEAQTSRTHRKEDFDVHKFETAVIHLIPHQETVLQLKNIQGINVLDARADTGNIGFMQKRVVDPVAGLLSNAAKNQSELRINRMPTFITLGNGLQQEARKYMDRSVAFPGNPSLPGILMVIKKLWLSDELNFNKQEQNNIGKLNGPVSRDRWTSGIDVKLEFYLKDGEDYYPLYRYDSLISKATTISEFGPEYIEQALQLSVQKLAQTDAKIEGIRARNKFSLAAIQQHNENEFNLPVLKDTALKYGVYMTFEEFKKNSPSQTSFELTKDKLTDIIFIKQPDGKEWMARDVWGYSNGENAYIRSGDNFFLLQRKENAFYIFGAKNLKRKESSTTGPLVYQSNGAGFSAPVTYHISRTSILLEPFQLDWSTGKLY